MEVGTLTRFGATIVRALIEKLAAVTTVDNPTVGRGDTGGGGVRTELRIDLQRANGSGSDRLTAERDTSTADVFTATPRLAVTGVRTRVRAADGANVVRLP